MGKGKGKAGRKEAKLAVKKINSEPKIPGLPPPLNPVKKAKKVPSREKNSLKNDNRPGPASFPIPMGRPKPFTKSPQYAKWPALFKKHLGVIEAHIRNLDRVMQSMRSEMGQMSDGERLEWELGEKGNWRLICEMMDRAREVLASAREAAKGILPARSLKDKKDLGVAGTNFEPLGPKLAKRAVELGYNLEEGASEEDILKETLAAEVVPSSHNGETSDDTHSDSDSNSSSDSDSDSDIEDGMKEGADFVPLSAQSTPRFSNDRISDINKSSEVGFGEENENKLATNGVEHNPYFVVDTEPTPVTLHGDGEIKENKKAKKLRLATERQAKKEKKQHIKEEKIAYFAAKAAAQAKETAEHVEPTKSPGDEIDFKALEATLQAEIEAGTRAQQRAEARVLAAEEKKAKKKRKRSSDGANLVVEKKAKKEEVEETTPAVEQKYEKKKRRRSSGDGELMQEKKAKKEIKAGLEKKREADDSLYGEETDAIKKKQKQKTEAQE